MPPQLNDLAVLLNACLGANGSTFEPFNPSTFYASTEPPAL